MAIAGKAQRVINRFEEMKREKETWIPMWSLIAEYVMGRKYPFTTSGSFGVNAPFILDKIFDKTGANACRLMASSIIGALWPNGAKTFQLDLPISREGTDDDTAEVRSYYEWATKVMVEKMDHPRAGLLTSLEEYMGDQGSFGTSGISALENEDDWEVPIQYTAVDVKQITLDEGDNGFIDTVYTEMEMTIRQAVKKYGLDDLSSKVRESFLNGCGNDKIKILHAVEPRIDRDPYGFGSKDMPIASIHLEIETKKIIKESGFHEMPIFVTRFWKTVGEKYGRSPAMDGMPDILEVNAMREASEIAVEKSLDPPLSVLDDGGLGAGVIDTSAGAINVHTVSGRLGNQKPIEPIYTVGELNTTFARITELKEDIKNVFFVDRLLDLNNEQRMTAYETNIREGLRGQSLGTVYARQMAELLTPLISRTFNVLFRRGLLGVVAGSELDLELQSKGIVAREIPEPIARMIENDEEAYKITFISPAARIMQNEEMLGIQKVTEYILGVAPVVPGILENFDEDYTIRRVQSLSGAPTAMLRAVENVKRKRAKNEMMQQAAMQLEAQRSNSETARNMAQALGTAQQAGVIGEEDMGDVFGEEMAA